ncbi:MAG TPA: hypothetical protein VGP76_20850 [Planctomycetaceae bacterium]|jgi:hypothetical protein|nr:hypothetical protein [Planctomycetaceae bacterium]
MNESARDYASCDVKVIDETRNFTATLRSVGSFCLGKDAWVIWLSYDERIEDGDQLTAVFPDGSRASFKAKILVAISDPNYKIIAQSTD